jgi:DNA (cytosine-5)-methyltransferase 1
MLLSLFPGIDLLGRGFEAEGFCVVRGPDLLWGGDIRDFSPPPGRFVGIIAGTPCQDFSVARRSESTGYGVEMLHEFVRIVEAARPAWWLLENVPTVPDVASHGYAVQRFDLAANECGLAQRRLRHFQFGNNRGYALVLDREQAAAVASSCVTASEGTRANRRGWSEFCREQGLPSDFDLPGMTLAAKYAAVGNGVPVNMARFVARAIRDNLHVAGSVRLCACGCGRRLSGVRQVYAGASCRKRMERRRKNASGHEKVSGGLGDNSSADTG